MDIENSKDKLSVERLLPAILLFLIVFAVYSPSLSYDYFSLDDGRFTFNNRFIGDGLTWEGTWEALKPFPNEYWNPVLWLSYMVDVEIFGMAPKGFHFTNVLLHTLNALLIWYFLILVTNRAWLSVTVAGLFALHPLRVESVVWISERKGLLSAFFLLLTLILYTLWTRGGGRVRYLAFNVTAFAALASKPVAVSLPFLLLLADLWPLGRLPEKRIRRQCAAYYPLILEKLPVFVMSLLFVVLTLVTQARNYTEPGQSAISLYSLLRAGWAYFIYLGKIIWPVGLHMEFFQGPQYLHLIEGTLSITAIVLLSGLALFFVGRVPAFSFAWLWYLVSLAPMSGFISVGSQWLSDRFTYLPHMGLLAGTAWLIHRGGSRLHRHGGNAVIACFMMLLIPMMVLTHDQTALWADEEVFWARSVQEAPEDGRSWHFLGKAQVHKGKYNAAANSLEKAIDHFPGLPQAHLFLAHAYSGLGDPGLAEREFLTVLEIGRGPLHPDLRFYIAEAHHSLGNLFLEQGQYSRAVDHYDQAVDTARPWQDIHLFNLGYAVALSLKGDLEGSVRRYREVLSLDPENLEAALGFAEILYDLGMFEEAAHQYATVSRLAPGSAEDFYARGKTYLMEDDPGSASAAFGKGLSATPRDPRIRDVLAANFQALQ